MPWTRRSPRSPGRRPSSRGRPPPRPCSSSSARSSSRALALEAGLLAAAGLLASSWFGAWPRSLPPALAALACLGLAAARFGPTLNSRIRGSAGSGTALQAPARLETLLCLTLALAYRLPALLHPWGFVNKDGAYMGFAAQSIRLGLRPAPAFTEGASYQGTLKGHLAALLGLLGPQDDAFLLALSSTLLSLLFILSTMSLARRIGGRGAALAAGLYLALGPKFPTAFQLNCIGQYVDVLALGGLALALLAKLLDEDRRGLEARGLYLGVGFLLGAAFWQQPVALSYVAVASTALLFRRASWRDPWVLAVPLGLLLGALPMLVWNLQHDWATREILGQSASGAASDLLSGLPRQAWRTFRISLPILAGVSPEHPWLAAQPALAWAAAALLPTLVLVALWLLRGQLAARGESQTSPRASTLPFLLLLFSLAQFFSVPAQRVHWRPRYLLPLAAVTAVLAGVVAARAWTRSRLATAIGFGALLALNVSGTLPRLQAGPRVAAEYRALLEQIERAGIRTGYADFSISAPVTLFTRERILLSPELGPTPYYVSDRHSETVRRLGPDAFVLRRNDDPEAFAAGLRELGASFERIDGPVTVFHKLSRRLSVEQARGYLVERDAPSPDEESSPE